MSAISRRSAKTTSRSIVDGRREIQGHANVAGDILQLFQQTRTSCARGMPPERNEQQHADHDPDLAFAGTVGSRLALAALMTDGSGRRGQQQARSLTMAAARRCWYRRHRTAGVQRRGIHLAERIRLGVNIDHVATLRQARGTPYPDPLHAAFQAAEAGADGITMHLREDRRHIQDRDVERVREHVICRLNLEMAPAEEMITIAEDLRPDDCCLVPEQRAELTTEGGLDVSGAGDHLSDVRARLAAAGIQVALFVDPEPGQIDAAAAAGAEAVEIHTGRYANARGDAARARELDAVARAADHAAGAGLLVHAGHGLHYHNVEPVAAVAAIRELNIGHAIVARALSVGLPAAVAAMKGLMRRART